MTKHVHQVGLWGVGWDEEGRGDLGMGGGVVKGRGGGGNLFDLLRL